MSSDGDDHLSAFDRHIWGLCYSTLERFGCVTIFKVRGPWAQSRINKSIEFFVPRDHPRADEVKAYLEDELRHEASAPSRIGDDWVYGTDVRVMLYSGIIGYVDRERMQELSEPLIENFMRALSERGKFKH